jgi:hypothetical protein
MECAAQRSSRALVSFACLLHYISRIADLDRFKPRAGLGRIWGLAKVETLGLEPGPALTRLGCPLMKNGNNLISSHFTFILFFLIFFDKIDL